MGENSSDSVTHVDPDAGLPETDGWKQTGKPALVAFTGGIQGFNVYIV